MSLKNLILAQGMLTGKIYLGLWDKKKNKFLEKTEVTDNFIEVALALWLDNSEEFVNSKTGERFVISAKKLAPEETTPNGG